MARYHRFQIWNRAMKVLAEVSQDVSKLRGESDLRDQIKRAARSTVANICEGSEMRSDKELRRYLVIARASNAEVQAWYEMALVAGLLNEQRVAAVIAEIDYCGRSLSRFIAKLEEGT